MNTESKRGCGYILINTVWIVIFAIYAAIAGIWWWIEPQGFPMSHPKFWANFAIPMIIIFASIIGMLSIVLSRGGITKTLVIFFVGLFISAFTFSLIQFPISFGPSNGLRFLAYVIVAGGSCLLLLLFAIGIFWFYPKQTTPYMPVTVAAVISLIFGVGVVQTQQSLPGATIPLNKSIPLEFQNLSPAIGGFQEPVVLNSGDLIWPRQATVQTRCGDLKIEIVPLLTFTSRSPDRFWTLFAPPGENIIQRRTLSGFAHSPKQVLMSYIDDGRSWLEVKGGGREPLRLDSYTHLPKPVFSHLNYYMYLRISGGTRLELSFASAGGVPIEFVMSDYPLGRPARMAYRNAMDRFSVVEASSAEKGPFHTLASGQLKRTDPLVFTLYDAGMAQCQVTLEDWAAQASAQLSPTAGWGFSENAVEFRLLTSNPASGALHISLANTSTGRGFDSVGHTAGVYRNRMHVRSLTHTSYKTSPIKKKL
jgi:hypothetical protein